VVGLEMAALFLIRRFVGNKYISEKPEAQENEFSFGKVEFLISIIKAIYKTQTVRP
jgi:hypothetical protein